MQYNKRCFFKEIFAFVFVAHLILLGVLFVCDTGKFHQERFVVNTNNLQSTVVFIPLKKRVQEQGIVVVPAGKKNNGTRKVINYNEYEKKLAQQKKKQKKVKKAVPIKKPVALPKPVKPVVKAPVKPVAPVPAKKASTSLQQEKNKKLELQKAKEKELAALAAQKLADKKAGLAKEQAALAAKIAADTAALEKQLAEKIVADNAAALAAQAKAQVELAKKIEELEQQKLAEAKITAAQQVIAEQHIAQAPAEQHVEQAQLSDDDLEDDEDDLETISFVGSHDLEMMQIKEKIQAEVVKYYKPPIGIAKKAVCELAVVVGAGGKAERVTVKKGSGSMANDMCARAALLHVRFPKEVIGKEIIVELGQ